MRASIRTQFTFSYEELKVILAKKMKREGVVLGSQQHIEMGHEMVTLVCVELYDEMQAGDSEQPSITTNGMGLHRY